MFENRSDTVTLRLAHIGTLVHNELRRVSPELAAQVPTLTTDRISEISGGDLGQATRVARAVAGAHTVGVLLVIAGAIAFLLAVAEAAEWRRPEWRRGARYVGIAILVDGVLLVIGDMLARTLVVSHFAAGDDRRAAGAVWNTFLSGLRPLALLLAGAGAVVVVLMWALRPQRRPAPGVPLSAGAGAAPARARPEPRQSRRGR